MFKHAIFKNSNILNRYCVVCERSLVDKTLLCKSCKVQTISPERKCKRCGSLQGGRCQLCKIYPLQFGTIQWITEYLDLLHILRALKFHGKILLSKYLTELLEEYISSMQRLHNWDGIVLSPVRDTSFRERGFNQLDLIVRPLARRLKLPVLDPFVKSGKEFQVHRVKDFDLKGALFIDDVLTLGETFRQSLMCFPKTVQRVDAIFISISNPHLLENALFRARLNWAWKRRF